MKIGTNRIRAPKYGMVVLSRHCRARGRIRSPEQDEDYYEETDDWYAYLWLVFGYLDEHVKGD